MNLFSPSENKCANVVNEIFCFLFLICLLSNTCSYIPVFLLQEQTIYNM